MKRNVLFSILFVVAILFGVQNVATAQQWSNGAGNDIFKTVDAGNVGVGIATPSGKMHIYDAGVGGSAMLQIEHNIGYTTVFKRVVNNAGNALFLMQKARGTLGAELTVQSGDKVGQLRMEAYDGAGYSSAGNIIIGVDGAVSPGIVPGNVRFQVTDNTGTLAERMRITSDGYVGIGTATPQAELAVNGDIVCREVEVTLTGWPDFVFDGNYDLPSLLDVEDFIKSNNHLPGVPSAVEVEENGLKLGQMDAVLLQKIEELTLYLIDLKKENEALKTRIEKLEK